MFMSDFIRIGAVIGIGALINKNTFEGGGGLIWKGALIGRRALSRIITVLVEVFLQVIQFSPLSSKIQFPYILSSLFFLADPSAVYGNLIHFCPERYSSTSNRLGN